MAWYVVQGEECQIRMQRELAPLRQLLERPQNSLSPNITLTGFSKVPVINKFMFNAVCLLWWAHFSHGTSRFCSGTPVGTFLGSLHPSWSLAWFNPTFTDLWRDKNDYTPQFPPLSPSWQSERIVFLWIILSFKNSVIARWIVLWAFLVQNQKGKRRGGRGILTIQKGFGEDCRVGAILVKETQKHGEVHKERSGT